MEQAIWSFIFSLVSSALSALIGSVVASRKGRKAAREKEEERRKEWEKALMLLLRSDLIRLHDGYVKKGYCPTAIKFSVREEYEGYHALGGNGVVTRLVEELMALPNEEKEKE